MEGSELDWCLGRILVPRFVNSVLHHDLEFECADGTFEVVRMNLAVSVWRPRDLGPAGKGPMLQWKVMIFCTLHSQGRPSRSPCPAARASPGSGSGGPVVLTPGAARRRTATAAEAPLGVHRGQTRQRAPVRAGRQIF